MSQSTTLNYSTSLRSLLRRFVVLIVVIGSLILLSSIAFYVQLQQQKDYSNVINLSGRQRMLSQRIAKSSLEYLSENQPTRKAQHFEELKQALAQWQEADGLLRQSGQGGYFLLQNSAQINQMYAQLASSFESMTTATIQILETPLTDLDSLQASLDTILTTEDEFLSQMDAIVFKYDSEANQRFQSLVYFEVLMAMLLIVTLIIGVLIIFRPAFVKIQKSTSELEQYFLAVENSADVVVITDPDGIIQYANPAVQSMLGYTQQEVIGQKAGTKDNWGGNMEKKYYRELWQTIKEKKQVFFAEFNNKTKDGRFLQISAHMAPILSEDGEIQHFVDIERNVTHEKEVDKAKTEFVSLASHQLRTPLSAVNWYAELLMDEESGKLNPEQKEYLDQIYHSNQRMVELVNALLNVSRLELGTFTIEPESANLRPIAQSVVKELQPQIQRKRIQMIVDLESQLSDSLFDIKLTRMIFQNLLSNAVKYTSDGGKVSVSIKQTVDSFMIMVSDTGMGIPENQQKDIFSKLFRADNARSMDTEGTGLGLYIVKSILDHTGGKIWFESSARQSPDGSNRMTGGTQNKGTTFYVTIPLIGMKPKVGTKTIDN